MLERLRENFNRGIERLRWFSELLGERIKVEIAFFKLMGKAEELKRKRAELAQAIGEKVFESRQQISVICKDEYIQTVLREMEMLNEELTDLTERASNISRPVDPGKNA
ncbi:MAG: hypothetical protein M0Z59_04465 [Nitrospiraceae bacterium]|nr:hypothetical protein [Nitrospiraceae bacterium]